MTTAPSKPPSSSRPPLASGGRHATTYYIGIALGLGLMAVGVPEATALAVAGPIAGVIGGLWRRLREDD